MCYFTNYCQLAHTIYKSVLVLCVFVQAVYSGTMCCSNQVTHYNWQRGCELKCKQMPKSCMNFKSLQTEGYMYRMGIYIHVDSICIAHAVRLQDSACCVMFMSWVSKVQDCN